MKLTDDDKWMLTYTAQRIRRWHDVKDNATRAMKKITSHQDFLDWCAYFLPKSRRNELVKALNTFQHTKVPTLNKKVPIQVDEHVAKALKAKAKAHDCSVSDVLLKLIA